MDGKQNIYYALGILSYAIAKADGKVQQEEKDKLHEIVRKEVDHNIDFEYAEIIFQLLENQKIGFEKTYVWALAEFKKGRHYLTPELKEQIIEVIVQLAKAFDHITSEEVQLIERFERDIKNIGSPHSLE